MRIVSIRNLAGIALGLFIGMPQLCSAQAGAGTDRLPTCTGWSDCNSGRPVCTVGDEATSFWPSVVIADGTDGVSSDGRGRYIPGSAGVRGGVVQAMAAFLLDNPRDSVKNPRTLTVNLNRPVPGGGGVPLGIFTDSHDTGLYTTLPRVGDTLQNLHDIRVGQTVTAGQMNVLFHINGRFHVLQMGPQAFGNCHLPATLVNGAGTSSGTIHRAGPAKWAMDLPAGSVGRLFDISHTTEHAADKGLYYVHLRYEIGDDAAQTGVLAGRITNEGDNGPLGQAGVNVFLTNGTRVAGTVTRSDGSYRTPHVPVGTYQVRIHARGFSPHVATEVTIRVDQTATLNAALKPSGG